MCHLTMRGERSTSSGSGSFLVSSLSIATTVVVVFFSFSRELKRALWFMASPSGLGRRFARVVRLILVLFKFPCNIDDKFAPLCSLFVSNFSFAIFCKRASRAARSIQGLIMSEACAVAMPRSNSSRFHCCCCCSEMEDLLGPSVSAWSI